MLKHNGIEYFILYPFLLLIFYLSVLFNLSVILFIYLAIYFLFSLPPRHRKKGKDLVATVPSFRLTLQARHWRSDTTWIEKRPGSDHSRSGQEKTDHIGSNSCWMVESDDILTRGRHPISLL